MLRVRWKMIHLVGSASAAKPVDKRSVPHGLGVLGLHGNFRSLGTRRRSWCDTVNAPSIPCGDLGRKGTETIWGETNSPFDSVEQIAPLAQRSYKNKWAVPKIKPAGANQLASSK